MISFQLGIEKPDVWRSLRRKLAGKVIYQVKVFPCDISQDLPKRGFLRQEPLFGGLLDDSVESHHTWNLVPGDQEDISEPPSNKSIHSELSKY